MPAWWAKNIKYHEQLAFYHSFVGDKCPYRTFSARVQKWLPYDWAIQKENRKWKHLVKGLITDTGRECTKCKVMKPRSEYNKNYTAWLNFRQPYCKVCQSIMKKEYRKKTWYLKDKQYKEHRRKLAIGQKIAFCEPMIVKWLPREVIREVQSYEKKKWYLLYSSLLKEYTRLSTSDNHNHPQNKLCKRFYIVE